VQQLAFISSFHISQTEPVILSVANFRHYAEKNLRKTFCHKFPLFFLKPEKKKKKNPKFGQNLPQLPTTWNGA